MKFCPMLMAVPWAGLAKAGRVQWAGVNLFGLANDISILGSAFNPLVSTACHPTNTSYPYIDDVSHYKSWRDRGFNLFRIAIAWQHAQTELGGSLNETNMRGVDKLIEAITGDGGQAIIDIHNYARWYCAVIGQPERSFLSPTVNVTNAHFSDLWVRLAARYKSNPNVIFQLMNEPHDLDIEKWADTTQEAILAIRTVTTKHTILVSGTQFARLVDWQSFSMPALGPGLLQDPANRTMYDFHQYFDDLGGAYGMCEPWAGYVQRFEEVTALLRRTGYRALLTEFGGGPFPQCAQLVSRLLAFLDRNSDVWYGWTAWGSFNIGSDLYLSLERNATFNAMTRVLEDYAPLRNMTAK
ncbi:hypothetical protein PCL_02422 [Purpureocillium lilacinum]|uniref:cellulase n=1 Tax=Purpureocillium lilacinum TaxID=33203 RepID=A0A2U3E0H6_PURLI|nr:hypothetical protein PCL_02422 [Purpureocillium lilacinum]